MVRRKGSTRGTIVDSGSVHFGAAMAADGVGIGSCSLVSKAGKSSLLSSDVGVRKLSSRVAGEQGLV